MIIICVFCYKRECICCVEVVHISIDLTATEVREEINSRENKG